MVLGLVPMFFLYWFYVYFAQLHIPSLLCVFRDEYVSQGLPGTAQGGPMSLIPRIKYLRMSGTIILDNENVLHDESFIYRLGNERCILYMSKCSYTGYVMKGAFCIRRIQNAPFVT